MSFPGVILFILSITGCFLGYTVFVKRPAAFFPLIYISYSVTVLYLFGLTGHLKTGYYALIFTGIFFLPVVIRNFKEELMSGLKEAFSELSWLYMAIGIIWIFVITADLGVSHPDDFSHWFKICRIMHFESAYPSTPDLNFSTYPPATATWIWYVTSLIGFSPAKCFFANSIINLAALNALFAAGKKREGILFRIVTFVFVSVMSVVLCSMSLGTYCLLTDIPLGLVPLAMVFWIENTKEDEEMKDIVILILMMTFESLIKIPGLMFMGFAYVCWLKSRKRVTLTESKLKSLLKLIPAIIPLVLFYAYIFRANHVYGKIELSGQGFSLTRYLGMFLNKTGDQVTAIIGRFFYEVFVLTGDVSMQIRAVWAGIILSVIGCVVLWKIEDKHFKEVRKVLIRTVIFVAVYMAFMLLTYVFSMNAAEANSTMLNCFYRYTGTVAIFVWGILGYTFFNVFSERKGKAGNIGITLLISSVIITGLSMFHLGYITGFDRYINVENFTTAGWDLCTKYAEERTKYNEDSYFVIYDENDIKDTYPAKVRLIGTVYFRSNNVYTYTLSELEKGQVEEKDMEKIRNCRYLVTMGDFSSRLDTIGRYVNVDGYKPGTTELNGGTE